MVPAVVLAVGAATIWNYIVNSRWTWVQGTGDRGQGSGNKGQAAFIDDSSSVVGRRSSVVAEEVIA